MLADSGAELLAQVGVREREHPAVGMADHERLLVPSRCVGDDE